MAPLHNDCQTVRVDWLIREIDRSFQAWEENAYTQNASFDDFCDISYLIAIPRQLVWIVAERYFIVGIDTYSMIPGKIFDK